MLLRRQADARAWAVTRLRLLPDSVDVVPEQEPDRGERLRLRCRVTHRENGFRHLTIVFAVFHGLKDPTGAAAITS